MTAAHRWAIRHRVDRLHVATDDARLVVLAHGWARGWGLPPSAVVRVALAAHRYNRGIYSRVTGGIR